MNIQGIKIDKDPATYLLKLIAKNGPDRSDYSGFTQFIQTIGQGVSNGEIARETIGQLAQNFGSEFLAETLHGHCLSKPFGYAGDFMIIDKIYTQHHSANTQFRKWDAFFHELSATKAVRNRKDYFKKTLKNRIARHNGKPLDLLNIASGPARDLYELYAQIDPQRLSTTCVDMDENAIRYAGKLNAPYLDRIEFIHRNIFKFRPEKQYDVIWSAGLFDYFDDAGFVAILKRMREWVRSGGEIIIGNFSENNPTRAYMELFGEWYLHHRSEEQLQQLALEAGFTTANIRVGKEKEGVNLFLHLGA